MQGSSQKIEFSFSEPKNVTQINIQFQGGFAAKQVELQSVENCDSSSNNVEKHEFHPRDTNQFQEFKLEKPMTSSSFKLTLNSSFDFYGRVIIYHFDVIGS